MPLTTIVVRVNGANCLAFINIRVDVRDKVRFKGRTDILKNFNKPEYYYNSQ